jgi:hypothetical protein
MYGIASVERHKKTPIGYPYLISLNSKRDQRAIQKDTVLKPYFLDSRTIDCRNKENCVAILNRLISQRVTNLDCGGFQLNYMYWKMEKSKYFDVEQSYKKACSIVMFHNEKKWTWKNIAKYHSKTKKYNDRYKKNLQKIIEKTYADG